MDIWGCNGYPYWLPVFTDRDGGFRADQWWQIHPMPTWDIHEHDWFSVQPALQVPTVVLSSALPAIHRRYPDVTALLPYDIERMQQRFPGGLFASTFCLMMASAIELGYQQITLYGAECLDIGRELVVERPALTYWLGYAHACGIEATFMQPTTLGHHPYIYGAEFAEEALFASAVTERALPPEIITVHATGNLNTVKQTEAFLQSVDLVGPTVTD